MGRPGAGATNVWPARACSCVYGILGSCPPLPDKEASPRVRKGGGPGVDSTRTPLTRIRTSMISQQSIGSSDLPFPNVKAKEAPLEHATVPTVALFSAPLLSMLSREDACDSGQCAGSAHHRR